MAKVDELLQIDGRVVCSTCAGDGTSRAEAFVVAPPDVNSHTDFLGKRCCSCGADVSQTKRFRDTRGYWCEPCNLADSEKKRVKKEDRLATKHRPKRLRCLECGKKAPRDELTKFKGLEVCPACVEVIQQREREEKERASRQAARGSRFQAEDEWMMLRRRRRIMLVAVTVMVLVFLSLWQNGIILAPSLK